jgi:hypothetical protein
MGALPFTGENLLVNQVIPWSRMTVACGTPRENGAPVGVSIQHMARVACSRLLRYRADAYDFTVVCFP